MAKQKEGRCNIVFFFRYKAGESLKGEWVKGPAWMVLFTPGGGLGGPHWGLLQIPFPYDPDAVNIADAVLF